MRKLSAVSMAVAMGMMGAASMVGAELAGIPYSDNKRGSTTTARQRTKSRARNKAARKSRIFNAQRARGVR